MNPAASLAERRRARRARILLAVFAAAAALWLLALSRLHVNASGSDAAWGYFLLPLSGAPRPGDRVVFSPPAALGAPTPFLKTVRGLPGARIAVDPDRTVRVDGAAVGKAKTHARDGRPLIPIRPGVIPPDHFYLHSDHPDSHDSRYAEIGLVPRSRLLGRAAPLPDIPWLGLEGPLAGPETVRADAVSKPAANADPPALSGRARTPLAVSEQAAAPDLIEAPASEARP